MKTIQDDTRFAATEEAWKKLKCYFKEITEDSVGLDNKLCPRG